MSLRCHQWHEFETDSRFNLGIELTQLIVVALIMPSLMLLSRTQLYSPIRTAVASLGIVLAAAWLAERTTTTWAASAGTQADGDRHPRRQDEALWTTELENPDYRTYQRLVSGLIEFVDLPHGGSLCCNDEAKIYGLPPNIRATSLLYLLRPQFIGMDFIAGDVVLLGQPDDDGDTTAAPELYVRLLVPPWPCPYHGNTRQLHTPRGSELAGFSMVRKSPHHVHDNMKMA
jgi:Domain of unknown function (DUF3846)